MKRVVAARIRELREGRGWTQAQLAQEAHTTVSTVSRWETGKSVPRGKKLATLSAAFHVAEDALAYGASPDAIHVIEHSPRVCFEAMGADHRYKAVISLHNWLRANRKYRHLDRVVMDILEIANAPPPVRRLWRQMLNIDENQASDDRAQRRGRKRRSG
jgi:transcriptional regulator with XRE-family HTH domain